MAAVIAKLTNYLRLRHAVGMSARRARRAVAAWTPPPSLDVHPNTSGIFNPHHGLYGQWPGFSWTAFGTLVQGSEGDGIGYFRGILFWKANQPCRPAPNPGPHHFTTGTRNCVVAFKSFFGIPNASNGAVDPATWQAIQWCAWNLPNRSL
jgi:hypothetical protein